MLDHVDEVVGAVPRSTAMAKASRVYSSTMLVSLSVASRPSRRTGSRWPSLVGPRGLQSDGGRGMETAALPAGHWPLQALGAPEPPGALGVKGPSLPAEHVVGLLPPPAGMGLGDLAEPTPELRLATGRRPRTAPLGGPMLAQTRQALLSETPKRSVRTLRPADDAPG